MGQFVSLIGSPNASNPLVGTLPFFLIFSAFFGSDKLFGCVPTMLVAVAFGVGLFNVIDLLQHTDSDMYMDGIDAGIDMIGEGGLWMPDLKYGFKFIEDHFGLVSGLAFTNFVGTLACNISARIGGDIYSPMESMMIDGLGTMLG